MKRNRSQAMVCRDGKLLLVEHRMKGRDFFNLPGGGIEENETPEEAALLQEYMTEVVQTGTGTKLKGMSYQAAGKTGSAEFSDVKGESHAWFVGYAHREDKEDIAVAVIVEGAGIGSAYAVPIAKEVFDMYYRY